MRIATDAELWAAHRFLVEKRTGSYRDDLLAHPETGKALRNYLVLTAHAEQLNDLCLSDEELFWSRYYWFARLVRASHAIHGFDAGMEQQLFKVLETAPDVCWDVLPEIDAAVERDTDDRDRIA